MKIREFRIPLPMSLEDYHVAQLWAVNEQSRRVFMHDLNVQDFKFA